MRTFLPLLLLCCSGFRGWQAADELASIRSLYREAVESSRATARALEEVEVLRNSGRVQNDSVLDATLAGYRGALFTLRAKHATWPPSKLRDVRKGLATLDSVVSANPEHAEVRYLRLITCYHLPGIFGRQSTVRADMAALAEMLPTTGHRYPPEQGSTMARFVLENGSLTPTQRQNLDSLLSRLTER